MRRMISIMLVLGFIMTVLGGCTALAPAAEPSETMSDSETVTTTSAVTTTTTTTTTLAETTTAAPVVEVRRSPTTGMPVDADYEYRPVASVISNAVGASPQWDLNRADVVYEFLQEGRSITRFLAIFNEDVPDDAGPVRSCRFPFLDILAMWEAPIAFCGGSSVEPVIVDNRIVNENLPYYIDGVRGKYDKYFRRDSSRKAPHNLRVNLQLMRENTPEWDYPEDVLTFTDTEPTGTAVSKVKVNFTPTYEVCSYQYDEEQKVWTRYLKSGEVKKDADGTPITMTNLVVLKMHYKSLDTKANHLELTSTGSGEALFFIGGVEIQGTWERKSIADPLVFTDTAGNPVSFLPGKTWFSIVTDDAPIEVES